MRKSIPAVLAIVLSSVTAEKPANAITVLPGQTLLFDIALSDSQSTFGPFDWAGIRFVTGEGGIAGDVEWLVEVLDETNTAIQPQTLLDVPASACCMFAFATSLQTPLATSSVQIVLSSIGAEFGFVDFEGFVSTTQLPDRTGEQIGASTLRIIPEPTTSLLTMLGLAALIAECSQRRRFANMRS